MELLDFRATVVDYIPSHKAATGLAFAYWAAPVVAAVNQGCSIPKDAQPG